MARIDLNMTVPEWCDYASTDVGLPFGTRLPGRVGIILNANFKGTSMKDFCQLQRWDIFKIRGMGPILMRELVSVLACYGLYLEMSQHQVNKYTEAFNLENHGLVKEETPACINWEQRRWETVQMFLTRTIDLSHEEAIIMADEFIEEYKKSLTKITIL